MNKPAFIAFCLLASLPGGTYSAPMAAGKASHIGYVYPAGGQQGTTFTVKIGGENVYGARTVLISGAGVKAEVIDSKDPNEGSLDPKKKNKKKNEAVIDEIITLKVTVSPDAEPGDRDICLATTNAISNKLIFQVGQLPEVKETEPNNKQKSATVLPALPVLAEGQIMPGDVDWYKFFARKGQHLVVDVSARALLPYIADGVPGWFQAIVTLVNATGRQVAVADDFLFNQDPVLFYDVPEDGEYALSIRDSIYRGREDFVYRMRIGELPFITGVFPLGAPLGLSPVTLRLAGVNLPVGTLQAAVDSMVPPCRQLVVTNHALLSNRVLFTVGDGPEITETSPATREKQARTVAIPVIVNGCIRTPGEKHYYRFQGKQGQPVCIEVMARRLGSPLDSCVALLDPRGRKIGENDDVKDKGEGYITHQSDSELACVLPVDGSYTVLVYDTQGHGGGGYSYRLRIGPPMQDFQLRTTPAALTVSRCGSVPVTVHAIRKDGFAGEIRLSLVEPRQGIALDGPFIPAGMDSILTTMTASKTAAGAYAPRVFGTAEIGGKTITRQAVPAENLMQAFLYQHLFPFHEESVLVTTHPVPFRVVIDLGTNSVLKLPLGKDVTVPVKVTRSPGYQGPIRLQLVSALKGVDFRNIFIPARKNSIDVILRAESKTATNQQGNLVFSGTMQIEREATPEEQMFRRKKEAREKEARISVLGGTNAPVASAGASNNPPSTALSTNSPVAATKPAKADDTHKPFMVTRPVVVVFPAVSYEIVDAPVQKDKSLTKGHQVFPSTGMSRNRLGK